MQNDKDVVVAAIHQDPLSFKFASDQLKKDKEFVLNTIDENYGELIYNAADSLKDNEEIILKANSPLYTFPKTTAKKLTFLNSGSSLSILRKWIVNERDVWVRVELATNRFIDNPNQITRGWVKM